MTLSTLIETITYAHFGALLGLIFLLFLIKINHLFSKKQSKLFIAVACVNIALMVVTICDFTFSNMIEKNIYIFRTITTFLNFSCGPIIPLLLIIFKQKKMSPWLFLPLIINLILCFVSMFTNIVFDISVENTYDRGPLFFVPLTTTFFYLVMMLLEPDDFQRQGKKIEQFFMVSIILLTILSLAIEIVFGFHFINYICSAISIIAFYILKNILYFMIDPLTGSYNRQMYHQALSQIDKSAYCIIVFVDINDFKLVNDNFGHDEGDKTLITFVKIMHKHLKNKGVLYRIGGDEFAVLAKKTDITTLKTALDAAAQENKKNELSFAFGIAEYNATDDLHEVIRLADKSMYENKAMTKAKIIDLNKENENA